MEISDLITITGEENGKKASMVITKIGVSDTLYISNKGIILLKTDENRFKPVDIYCSDSRFAEGNKRIVAYRMNKMNELLTKLAPKNNSNNNQSSGYSYTIKI